MKYWTIEEVLKRAEDNSQLEKGIKVETEHSKTIKKIQKNPDMSVEDAAKEIAKDHLSEGIPDYYDRLEKMEKAAWLRFRDVDTLLKGSTHD